MAGIEALTMVVLRQLAACGVKSFLPKKANWLQVAREMGVIFVQGTYTRDARYRLIRARTRSVPPASRFAALPLLRLHRLHIAEAW
jgi:hypothetical protein